MQKPKTGKNTFDFLLNPLTILAAIVIAIAIGIIASKGNPEQQADIRNFFDWFAIFVTFCNPFGDMYLFLLKMTVYPILIAAITSSVAGLVKSPDITKFLSRMIIVFLIMVILAASIGTFAGWIFKPGANLSDKTRETLSKGIEKSEYKVDMVVSLSEIPEKKEKVSLIDFIVRIVPENVFNALANEYALQLVFFSILFGIAAGMLKGDNSTIIITLFEGFFRAFQKIIHWLMYLLPIALIFLLAGQISSSREFFDVLKGMVRFIILFYILGLIVIIINTVIIWKRSKEKFTYVFKQLLDPIIIALATRSSIATLPATIETLDQKLHFYESTTKLYMPLGINLGRFGNIIYFALASLFVSQLYATPMTISGLFFVIIGSIFAGTATAGATGIATLGLMKIVLGPLGLPIEAVLILFMTIDPIIDPMRTLLIVHSNMACNAMIAKTVPQGERRLERRETAEPRTIKDDSFINRIKNKGEINVAIISKNKPLFHMIDSTGNLSGIDVDIANLIAKGLEVKLNIIRDIQNEEDIVTMLNNGQADFALSRISMNSENANEMCLSKPYAVFNIGIILNKNQIQGKDVKNLIKTYNGPIGVVGKSFFYRSLYKIFPQAQAKSFADFTDLTMAVMQGEILAGYGSEIDIKYAFKTIHNAKKGATFAIFRSIEDKYALAIAKKNEPYIYIFNNIMENNNLNISSEYLISQFG